MGAGKGRKQFISPSWKKPRRKGPLTQTVRIHRGELGKTSCSQLKR